MTFINTSSLKIRPSGFNHTQNLISQTIHAILFAKELILAQINFSYIFPSIFHTIKSLITKIRTNIKLVFYKIIR